MAMDKVLHLERGVVIAHREDAVIEVGAAAAREDTAGVQVEGELIGLNGDGHRAGLDGQLQRVGALADALVAGDALALVLVDTEVWETSVPVCPVADAGGNVALLGGEVSKSRTNCTSS